MNLYIQKKIEPLIVFFIFFYFFITKKIYISINKIKMVGYLTCITNESNNYHIETGFSFKKSILNSIATSFSEYIERSFKKIKHIQNRPFAVATSIFKRFSKQRSKNELIERDSLIFAYLNKFTVRKVSFHINLETIAFLNSKNFNLECYELPCRFKNYSSILCCIKSSHDNTRGIHIFGSSANHKIETAFYKSIEEAYSQFLIYTYFGKHHITPNNEWSWINNHHNINNNVSNELLESDIKNITIKSYLFFNNTISFHDKILGVCDDKILISNFIKNKYQIDLTKEFHLPVIGIKQFKIWK